MVEFFRPGPLSHGRFGLVRRQFGPGRALVHAGLRAAGRAVPTPDPRQPVPASQCGAAARLALAHRRHRRGIAAGLAAKPAIGRDGIPVERGDPGHDGGVGHAVDDDAGHGPHPGLRVVVAAIPPPAGFVAAGARSLALRCRHRGIPAERRAVIPRAHGGCWRPSAGDGAPGLGRNHPRGRRGGAGRGAASPGDRRALCRGERLPPERIPEVLRLARVRVAPAAAAMGDRGAGPAADAAGWRGIAAGLPVHRHRTRWDGGLPGGSAGPEQPGGAWADGGRGGLLRRAVSLLPGYAPARLVALFQLSLLQMATADLCPVQCDAATGAAALAGSFGGIVRVGGHPAVARAYGDAGGGAAIILPRPRNRPARRPARGAGVGRGGKGLVRTDLYWPELFLLRPRHGVLRRHRQHRSLSHPRRADAGPGAAARQGAGPRRAGPGPGAGPGGAPPHRPDHAALRPSLLPTEMARRWWRGMPVRQSNSGPNLASRRPNPVRHHHFQLPDRWLEPCGAR